MARMIMSTSKHKKAVETPTKTIKKKEKAAKKSKITLYKVNDAAKNGP